MGTSIPRGQQWVWGVWRILRFVSQEQAQAVAEAQQRAVVQVGRPMAEELPSLIFAPLT